MENKEFNQISIKSKPYENFKKEFYKFLIYNEPVKIRHKEILDKMNAVTFVTFKKYLKRLEDDGLILCESIDKRNSIITLIDKTQQAQEITEVIAQTVEIQPKQELDSTKIKEQDFHLRKFEDLDTKIVYLLSRVRFLEEESKSLREENKSLRYRIESHETKIEFIESKLFPNA